MAIFVTVIHCMNMETDPILHLMEHHGVKPTANRILIAKALAVAGRPMSPGELEDALETIDKSVISRALSLFREQHLVHVIEDGDSLRYELCHSHHEDHDDDAHVHFHFLSRDYPHPRSGRSGRIPVRNRQFPHKRYVSGL